MPLERRCRLLLRVYPAWYRRERAGEMLDTLLEVSPPGRRWPSFRDAQALITGGLRVRGWAWCLSILWAALGASYSIYAFVLSAHVDEPVNCAMVPPTECWAGEPGVIINAAALAGAAWLVLTIPMLVAGLVRLRGRWLRAAAWASTWAAGLALMVKASASDWQNSTTMIGAHDKSGNWWLVGYRAAVSWEELAYCAAWLALGAAITLIMARPPLGRHMSATSSRSSRRASL